MEFIAIDFETATQHDPCEIGLTIVQNGKIVETISEYIKPASFPYFNPFHQRVHGISAADVQHAPDFEQLWVKLQPLLSEKMLVAHNAAFDMGVLRAILQRYDIALPHCDYMCSVSMARKVWKGQPSYSLGNICSTFGIEFTHHRAGADAEACAKLVLQAMHDMQVDTLEELRLKIKQPLKQL